MEVREAADEEGETKRFYFSLNAKLQQAQGCNCRKDTTVTRRNVIFHRLGFIALTILLLKGSFNKKTFRKSKIRCKQFKVWNKFITRLYLQNRIL